MTSPARAQVLKTTKQQEIRFEGPQALVAQVRPARGDAAISTESGGSDSKKSTCTIYEVLLTARLSFCKYFVNRVQCESLRYDSQRQSTTVNDSQWQCGMAVSPVVGRGTRHYRPF